MRLIEISRIKDFTTHLFAGDRFDGYLLAEAQFSTDATYTIDGHVNPEFVGEEQMMLPDYREGLVVWKRFRPICYEIIKGRKVPQQFRIIMKLPEALMDTLLSSRDLTGMTEKVSGLFLNISFRNNQLTCTTGIALKEFSMDKSLEHLWDAYAAELLKEYVEG